MNSTEVATHYRACHVCEALCGLKIETQGDQFVSIKPDKQDAFSQGHICPKGVAIQDIHEDPDRLRNPVERRGDKWVPVSWEYAFETAARNLMKVGEKYGSSAGGVYGGNPLGHSSDAMLNLPA